MFICPSLPFFLLQVLMWTGLTLRVWICIRPILVVRLFKNLKCLSWYFSVIQSYGVRDWRKPPLVLVVCMRAIPDHVKAIKKLSISLGQSKNTTFLTKFSQLLTLCCDWCIIYKVIVVVDLCENIIVPIIVCQFYMF